MTFEHEYETLIECFLNHEITVHEFEETYLQKFKDETRDWNDDIFDLLDYLFAKIDAFTNLPITHAANADDYTNEEQLRKIAREVLKEIRELPQ
jgi:superfamily II DNA or RNA helicase